MVRQLKRLYAPWLGFSMRHHYGVIILCGVLVLVTLLLVPLMGRAFLPEFAEGTLTVNMVTLPGTSLEKSDELGRMAEKIMLSNSCRTV